MFTAFVTTVRLGTPRDANCSAPAPAAPPRGPGDVNITIAPSEGRYVGKPTSRPYELALHVATEPRGVTLDGTTLTGHATRAAYDAATTGWFFDADRSGVLHVKTGTRSTGASFTVKAAGITIPTGTAPGGTPPVQREIPKNGWKVVSVSSEETVSEKAPATNAIDEDPSSFWHSKWSDPPSALPQQIVIDMGAGPTPSTASTTSPDRTEVSTAASARTRSTPPSTPMT